jgi:protein-disulfide isomerase
VIVPLFALANTDVRISGSFLAHAYASPVTLGVMIGLLAGKPLGTAGTAWLATRLSGRRLNPPVGWGAAIGAGTAAGIPFTVSLLIAAIAFGDPGHAAALAQAKLGVLSAAICAVAAAWASFRIIKALPPAARLRALYGRPTAITDLAVAVDPERDHIRGPDEGALVTLVEYGDFECPFCGQAEPVVRELIAEYGELRFVFRHLPLPDVHPHARLAAEGAEAAARQGKFWAMHDTLMDHQGALTFRDLVAYARNLDLDERTFAADLRDRVGTPRIAEDLDSADLATVSGTPTFFINGRRHHGAYDLETLKEAVHTAKALAMISA